MSDPEIQEHWDAAYAHGDAAVSWQQAAATTSLELIDLVASGPFSIIDVGGGSSTLVDGLLAANDAAVTVLDVSPQGMQIARGRLGESATQVQWVEADLLSWQPLETFDIWHDRAVLHFLTAAEDRSRYIDQLSAALRPNGHVVIGVFAEDGPEQCSGLPVRRFSQDDLTEHLGSGFETIATRREQHSTPSGKVQPFNWIAARRR